MVQAPTLVSDRSAAGFDRNASIDALRGLSILLVVLHHIGIRAPLTQTLLSRCVPRWFLVGVNFSGTEAVTIFFVISGFLITRRSQERWGALRNIAIGDFYSLRISRIVPLLLLVVLVLSVLHLEGVPGFVISKPGQTLAGAIASALGLHINWYEAVHGYLPGGWDVIWSLSIEEVFYIAFPVLCVLLDRPRLLIPALVLLAVSQPFTRAALTAAGNEIWLEKAYLPGFASIAVGVLSAILTRRVRTPERRLVLAISLIGWAGVCAILFAGGVVWKLVHHGYVMFLTLSAACIVVGAHCRTASVIHLPRVPGLQWLRSSGRLSYEIYLSHMFCVVGVMALMRRSDTEGEWQFLWYLPILAVCWSLGFVLSKGFTEPIEHWLRKTSLRIREAR